MPALLAHSFLVCCAKSIYRTAPALNGVNHAALRGTHSLQTFNRQNVQLVNTDGKGVERITSKGVVVAGKEYELDCIVFATGFETGYTADELGPQKAGFELIGRGGVRLSEKWSAGPRTLNSFSTHGFPNLFMQVMRCLPTSWTTAAFMVVIATHIRCGGKLTVAARTSRVKPPRISHHFA